MRIRKVVIPVAGLGTRGLPFSKELPKEMVPIIDTPAIHFIVEEAIEAGIEQVIFVTSRGKHALEDYFDLSPALEQALKSRGKTELADRIHRIGTSVNVLSVRQKEPLGLGHAVLCARPIVGNEPFAVCLGDEIFVSWHGGPRHGLEDLVRCANEQSPEGGGSVVGVMQVAPDEVCHYGIADTGGKLEWDAPMEVRGTVEKPRPQAAPSQWALVGRYVFDPAIFEHLAALTPGVGGEIQLTDALDVLAREGRLRALCLKGQRYDVGKALYYLLAQVDCAFSRADLAGPLKAALIERLGRTE